MIDSAALPTRRGERIDTLDIVRGFALFGILLMNIVAMGLPGQAYFNPAALGEPTAAETTTWFITHSFFEGTMRTLFSMLFGAGFVLLLDRLEARGLGMAGAKIYMRRMLLLMVFGVINIGVLAWYGDIVFAYGLCGVFLLVFWRSNLRGLMVWAAIFFAATTLMNTGGGFKMGQLTPPYEAAIAAQEAGETLSEAQEADIEAYDEMSAWFTSDPEVIAENFETYEDGWLAVGAANMGEYFGASLAYYAPFHLFDPLAAMLLGMIAFRIGLLQGGWGWKPVLALTVGALVIAVPVNLRETLMIQAGGYSPEAIFNSLATYDLGRVSMALAWLGVFLLLCKSPLVAGLKASVGAVGRMALTNYLAHSLMAAIVFIPMGWYGELARNELYLVVAGMWAVNIAFSMAWLSVFTMGPLEYLWRAGTYGSWPRLLKSKPAALETPPPGL
jgi:uncharacterized protein